ncbi:DNA primase [Rhodoblastus acidophilus]|uniref:DNA primase n=1 Tax=Rhodoblastus acidophilus TaxID=1074 RepID=A0A6N8DRT9_RHOAC|nr:phage/plasmid primase, P4 family [Rhodoblastus acidophilus]MCW2276363.1 putative DNA primase/helicase [Rhodoblastus acidophilus]MTV33018.1 DNA primase [Rhodoblastus acidophilus]
MSEPARTFSPLEAALDYAARGWAVFPCSPSPDKGVGKMPLTPKESVPGAKDGGFYLATCDAEQIRAWWRQWPRALIGVRTDARAGFVVDLDPRDVSAEDMLAALEEFCGGFPEGMAISRTQSGGLHLWFRSPVDIEMRNRANLFKKCDDAPEAIRAHVDVRGPYGYVIAPPSVMLNGRSYEWLTPPSGLLPEAPARLVDLIMERGEFEQRLAPRVDVAKRASAEASAVDDARRKYALAALDAECRILSSTPPGERSDTANICAIKIGHLVGAGILSRSVALAALVDACMAWGIKGNDKAVRPGGTIERGLKFGESEPADLSQIGTRARERSNVVPFAARAAPPDDGYIPPGEPIAPRSSEPGPFVGAPEEPSQTGGDDGGPAQGGGGSGVVSDDSSLDRRCAFLPMTDLGNAERFFARHDGKVLWCEKLGWLIWDGRRFARDGANDAVMSAVQATVRAIQNEAKAIRGTDDDYEIVDDRGKVTLFSAKVSKWGRASESNNRISAIGKLAAAKFAVGPEELDRDHYAINVLNGTLRVSKDFEGYVRLDPHAPKDRITKLARVNYNPDAEAPNYRAFLDQVQPPEADGSRPAQRFLAQWAGLGLTGDTSEQRLTFHYGKGRNGKGVWTKCLLHIGGDYADTIPIESFLDSGRARAGGQATPDLAKLPGVRLLTTSEPKKGATLDEGLVKLFTGEDRIDARHLNKEFFSFRPQAKLTMQGNYRPKISGTDEGIWQRMILVPWPITIAPAKQDRGLDKKLYQEASGIFNWCLDGLRDWLDHGLLLPETVKSATADYRADSDPLGRFLEVCTKPDLGKRVQAVEMHRLFCAWAKANGEAEWTMKGLGMALTERGIPKKKASEIWWLDLSLTKGVSDFVNEHGRAWTNEERERGFGDDEERDP